MPDNAEIVKAIEERVRDSNVIRYSLWCIGVTSTPKQSQDFHNYPPQFVCWETEDSGSAIMIRDLFRQKGMKMAPGQGEDNPRYVFIF